MSNSFAFFVAVVAVLAWGVEVVQSHEWELEVAKQVERHNEEMRRGRDWTLSLSGEGEHLPPMPDWMRFPAAPDGPWRWDNLTLLLSATFTLAEDTPGLYVHIDAAADTAKRSSFDESSVAFVSIVGLEGSLAEAEAWRGDDDASPTLLGLAATPLVGGVVLLANGSGGLEHWTSATGIVFVSFETNWGRYHFLFDPATRAWYTNPGMNVGQCVDSRDDPKWTCEYGTGPFTRLPSTTTPDFWGETVLATPKVLRRIPTEASR